MELAPCKALSERVLLGPSMGSPGGGALATACNRKFESSSMKCTVGFDLVRAAKKVNEKAGSQRSARSRMKVVVSDGIGLSLEKRLAILAACTYAGRAACQISENC